MKSKKLVRILAVIAAVLFAVLLVTAGMVWYRATHVFVEGEAYPLKAESLDLREKDISFAHYDTLQQKLPGCSIVWNVPFQGQGIPSDSDTLTLVTLTPKELNIITRYFPNLKTVNAGACRDYEILESLQEKMPQVEILYQVSLGKTEVDPLSAELVLKPEDYSYEDLLANLKHLPKLETLQLKTPELSAGQVDALREAYPQVAISCTVEILGQEYDTETETLDLSALTGEKVDSVAEKLPALTGLKSIELNDKDGNSILKLEEVKKLKDAAPEVSFHYSFDFFGERISTTDEEVKLHNKKIGDEGVPQVRTVLDLMENCRRFVLENCRISNDAMAKLRDDYRDRTKIVWRIYFGEGTSLTDAEVLRSTYNVTDDDCHDLVYLEDVRYMDIGHNEFLDNIPFVEGMKSLEVVIISGAPVHDLAPFKHCPNLRILEMANCLYVPDLEPLKECKNLEMLNIGFTKISDLTPLDDLKLTHLSAVHTKLSEEEQKRFQEVHPDAVTTFQGDIPYGVGWRYDENDDKLPWYEDISQVFRYPNSPNNVGWYLKKDEEKK